MKKYTPPKAELVSLDGVDVITSSGIYLPEVPISNNGIELPEVPLTNGNVPIY